MTVLAEDVNICLNNIANFETFSYATINTTYDHKKKLHDCTSLAYTDDPTMCSMDTIIGGASTAMNGSLPHHKLQCVLRAGLERVDRKVRYNNPPRRKLETTRTYCKSMYSIQVQHRGIRRKSPTNENARIPTFGGTLLGGTILNRTYGATKNPPIPLFLLTILLRSSVVSFLDTQACSAESAIRCCCALYQAPGHIVTYNLKGAQGWGEVSH